MKTFPSLPRHLSPTLEHFLRYIYPHCPHCRLAKGRSKDEGHHYSCSHDGCQLSHIPKKVATS